MAVTFAGRPSSVQVRVAAGFPSVVYAITLGLGPFEDGQLDDEDGSLAVFVQGCLAAEEVTFATSPDGTTYTDIATVTADANGDINMDLFIPSDGAGGIHQLRATAALSGQSNLAYTAGTVVGGTADPGVDAAPLLVPGSTGRWVLQDLMPGGLGSWVMPINPTSMTNPHLTKTVNGRSTTAPRTGRYHLSEDGVGVVAWTLSGYCPNEPFQQQLVAYAELNRRIYVIDHRGRAWKCAVRLLEITPRKRQLDSDGTNQDWAADYRLNLDLLDQTFVAVA